MLPADLDSVVISRTPDNQFTKNELAVWSPAFFKEPAVKLPYDFRGQRVQGSPRYQYGRTISGKGLNLIRIALLKSHAEFTVRLSFSVVLLSSEVAWNCAGIPLRRIG